ncbi:MAG TPA: hypothetical protein PKA10_07570 [Selenomonadales bacterium]|nr:hypothetical protein [Selenomonadales bacterium]
MPNFVLMRLSCSSVFKFCFCAGACLAGAGGILVGLLEQSSVGVLGGAFFGLAIGLISGVIGAGYTAVFNLLAPLAGGIAIRLEPLQAAEDSLHPPAEPLDPASPNPGVSRDLQPPS